MDKINVLKRGKVTEPFQSNKIKNVTQAAGLKPDQAQQIADQITQWVSTLTENTINSEEIRARVIAEMKKMNAYAADLFQWYEKNKE